MKLALNAKSNLRTIKLRSMTLIAIEFVGYAVLYLTREKPNSQLRALR
jgi:sugar phosphate permease